MDEARKQAREIVNDCVVPHMDGTDVDRLERRIADAIGPCRTYEVFYWVDRLTDLRDRHGRLITHKAYIDLSPADILELSERVEVWPRERDGQWTLFIDVKGRNWQQR